MNLLLISSAILLFVVVCIQIIGVLISGPVYKGPITDHFDGKKFINPTGVKAKGFVDVLRWMSTRKRGKWISKKVAAGPKPKAEVHDNIRLTFINHSTFLIQVDGINILTDPVWSARTSPFHWAGPKRMREPGILFSDLPKIDFVLLSHNHYDHFDLPTIQNLKKQHNPEFVVPLGLKAHLSKMHINAMAEMDWWQMVSLNKTVSIQSVPAQHFSGRGTIDRDRTLWCGFVINTSKGKLYFAGDTGYNPVTFVEIGNRIGPVDVALIPIGAYKPQWFMAPIHVDPNDAVQIHKDVKSKLSIGMHFGTFPLADDSEEDPINDLGIALNSHHLNSKQFIVLKEGTPFDLLHHS